MYKYFKVKNFRCFKELELNDLGLVNLIAGINNVGKTALLEALFLHCGAYNPGLLVSLSVFRGIENISLNLEPWFEHPFSSFFHDFTVSNSIELIGKDTTTRQRTLRLNILGDSSEPIEALQGMVSTFDRNGEKYLKEESSNAVISTEFYKEIELEYQIDSEQPVSYHMIVDKNGIRIEPRPPNPEFLTFFQNSRKPMTLKDQAINYGRLELRGKHSIVLDTLRIVEPRLKEIKTVVLAGGAMLHGDIGIGHLIPLPNMGGGIMKLTEMVLCIANAKNGVVLIDEIENGFHHSVLSNVWKAIAQLAKQTKTQIFATTHSWECISAAHEAFSADGDYDFRLHRLDMINGEISAVTYNKELLDTALEVGMEVR